MGILITSANSAQAYRLKNELNTDNVILGDYNELPAFMLEPGKMIVLPNPESEAYAHEMLTCCLDNAIDIVYVLDKNEAKSLLEARRLFSEYGIDIQLTYNEV